METDGTTTAEIFREFSAEAYATVANVLALSVIGGAEKAAWRLEEERRRAEAQAAQLKAHQKG